MIRLSDFFADLPAGEGGVSSLLTLWALIIILFASVDLIVSIRLRRIICLLMSLLPFGYGLAALLISERLKLTASAETGAPVFLPLHLLSVCTLTFCALLLRHFRKTKISPASIAESFDRLSSGVCFYLEGGRCVLVNEKMRALSFLLTGHTVRSGEELAASVPPDKTLTLPDGSVRSVTLRQLTRDGAPLFELTAADVSELSLKTARLKRENERLARMNDALRAYSGSIGEHVRQNEILRAKMNIHDEMNRLLLQTQIALENKDPGEMKTVAGLWQNSALLLQREAEENAPDDVERDLETLASSFSLSIVYENRFARRDALFLRHFTYAAREAILNAVKHARAKNLFISFTDLPDSTAVTFRNDGPPPPEAPTPRGGLKDLKDRLETIGGSLSISARDALLLTVIIPKGET